MRAFPAWPAAAAVAVAVLLPAAPAAPAAPATAASHSAAGQDVDRRVRDPRITEASGLAVSPQHSGVLWTHDDSGHAPLLFALARSGRVAATLALQGTADVDWEAIAAFRDAAGRALLAVGDLGDNRGHRPGVEVDVVDEPGRIASASAGGASADRASATVATPLLRLLLTYPDGPVDAETLLVDPIRRRMFVVTKELFGGRVYVVPRAAWDGTAPKRPTTRSARLVHVGDVPLGLVTDGTVTPGGAVLLRTYTQLAAFAPFPVEGGNDDLPPLASSSLPLQRQGEGLALAPDGRSVLLSSEGVDEPILRVALTPAVRSALSGSWSGDSAVATPASPATSRTAAAAPSSAAAATAPAGNDGNSLPWAALALAAGVVGAIAVAFARSRR